MNVQIAYIKIPILNLIYSSNNLFYYPIILFYWIRNNILSFIPQHSAT